MSYQTRLGGKKEHYPFSRDNYLRKFKWEGFSVIQLERLTGINRGVIKKASRLLSATPSDRVIMPILTTFAESITLLTGLFLALNCKARASAYFLQKSIVAFNLLPHILSFKRLRKSAGGWSVQDQSIIPTDLYVYAHYVLSIEEAVDLGSVFEDRNWWLIGLNRLHLGPGIDHEKLFQDLSETIASDFRSQ